MIVDFETQSGCDLSRCGAFRYWEDKSTRVLCLAAKNGVDKFVWIPPEQKCAMPESVNGYRIVRGSLDLPGQLTAHNANGFESIKLQSHSFTDTAIICRENGLPGKLEKAATELGIGHKLDGLKFVSMMNPDKRGKYPQGTRPLWYKILEYCIQDVELTRKILDKFPSSQDPDYCELHRKIQHRGIWIDREFTHKLIEVWSEHEHANQKQLREMDFENNIRSNAQVLEWIQQHCGLKLDYLNKGYLSQFLSNPERFIDSENPDIQRAIAILNRRSEIVRVGSSKLARLLDMTTRDGRFKGGSIMNGSHTGRSTGYGAQPYNLPRPPKGIEYKLLCENLSYELVKENAGLIGVQPSDILNGLTRPCFRAAPGKKLIVADYSMIEARIVAWLAGDHSKMNLLNSGLDPYVEFGKMVGTDRQGGKIGILGCGYQMGPHRCAAQYGIPFEQARIIVKAYRERFPRVREYWPELQAAALKAMDFGPVTVGAVTFCKESDERFTVTLPSGRKLVYRNSKVEMLVARWRVLYNAPAIEEPTFTYRHVYGYQDELYGGKWAENIVQAIGNDLLRDAEKRVESEGMPIVLDVYDEIVCEVDRGEEKSALADLLHIMETPPRWASGLVTKAEGMITDWYYKK